jgi:ATP-dependent helicase/nuclease subunit B
MIPPSSPESPVPDRDGPSSEETVSGGEPPRRVFTGWRAPFLPGVVRMLLDEAGVEESSGVGGRPRVDLRETVVALPGARAGRRLGELLVDEAEARGARLLPPEITTVGALPERCYRASTPRPDPVLDRAAWNAALRSIPRADVGLLMAELPSGAEDPGWRSLSRTARALHRTVGAGGWDFEEVSEACREGLLFSDRERWRVLAGVQRKYREILRRHAVLDREGARRQALGGELLPFEKSLWLVGVVDMPPVVRRFLGAVPLSRPATVVVPAPGEWEDRFDEWGILRPEAFGSGDLPLLDGLIRVLGDPGEQADAVVDILGSLGREVSPEDITLGVPDPQVAPHLVERLSALDVPARTLPGRPPGRTAAFRLLEALADYLEGREYEAFADLIRHPAVEGVLSSRIREGGGRSIPGLADEYHARHLPARLEGEWLPGGGRGPGARDILPVRDALEGLLEDFAGERPLAEWTEPLRGLLTEILGRRPLNRALEGERETVEMGARLRDALEGLRNLPPELAPTLPAHRAVQELLEELRDGDPLPPPGEEGAVEILGWLELALDDAPVLVVTGMNEPHVPEAMTADPFLPHQLRVRLGLLDNQGRFARDLVQLRAIVESRAEGRGRVVLLAGRRDGEGSPLRLSRLLLGGTPEEVARRLVRFLGAGEEEEGGAPSPEGSVGTADGDPAGSGTEAFRLPPEPELRAESPPDRISVTRFRRILADPYLYALEAVLRLETVDDEAREMDPLLFGSVAHDVLESWGRSHSVGSPDEKVLRGTLEELLDEEMRDRFGTRPLPAVRLQASQLRIRLGAFARWQAAHRSAGWEVAGLEMSPDGEGVPFDVDGRPILLRGRIDRVDHHPDQGRWLLLDYKTGDRVDEPDKFHRAGRKGSRRWVDLQLPLYRLLARALRSPDGGRLISPAELERLELGYVALPRDRDRTGLLLAEWTREELAGAEEAAREAVRLLRENRFLFDPSRFRVRAGDPLAPLLGQGVLAWTGDEESDDGEGGP